MKRTKELLEAALIGYKKEQEKISAKIAEIRKELRGGEEQASPAAPKKRRLSAAGRQSIVNATRKRWAAFRAAKAATAKKR